MAEKGDVLSRTTVQRIPEEDLIRPSVQAQLKIFDGNVMKRLNNENFRPKFDEEVYNTIGKDFDDSTISWGLGTLCRR